MAKCTWATSSVLMVLILSGCGAGEPTETMTGEFSTLEVCLKKLSASTGLPLKVVVDEPGLVTGFLGDTKQYFGCKRKVSGTKGSYYEGWYTLKK